MPISQLLSIFNKPYPADTDITKQTWAVVLVSIFVFIFLFIFKPFGLHNFSIYNRFIICLGYGGCTAIAMTLNFLAFNRAANPCQLEENWTVSKHIIWNGWMLLSIALINFIYSNLIGLSNVTMLNMLISLGQVFLIGLFPVAGLVLTDYLRLYRKNMSKAQELHDNIKQHDSHSSAFITLQSSNNEDRLQLNPDELLYITSADNYVKVVYSVNTSIKQKLLRGTLKQVATHISHPKIMRCHRSYIINLMQVTDISGNARGYTLSLRNTNTTVPVSQTYLDRFNRQMAGG